MQIKRNIIRLAILLLAAGSLGACRGVPHSSLVLDSDIWVVVDTVSFGNPSAGKAASPLSIEFQHDGQLNGMTSCNNFHGSYMTRRRDSVAEIGITIEGITLSLCPDSEREQFYIEQLKRARRYAVSDQQLRLMDDKGTVLLMFVPATKTQKTNNKTTL